MASIVRKEEDGNRSLHSYQTPHSTQHGVSDLCMSTCYNAGYVTFFVSYSLISIPTMLLSRHRQR